MLSWWRPSTDKPDAAANSPFRLQPFQKIATSSNQYEGQSTDAAPSPPTAPPAHVATGDPQKWFALEKIHGAQLQIYAGLNSRDGSVVVRCAKRSGWLDPFDSFFGFQEVVQRYTAALESLLLAVRAMRQSPTDAAYVVLYGELFGGWFPDDNEGAAAVTGSSSGSGGAAVQEGIWYSPRKEFAVFDLATVDSRQQATLLPFTQMRKIATDAGLFVVPVIGEASCYGDLTDVNLNFDSRVPALLNEHDKKRLQPLVRHALPAGTNVAEGVVVRPDVSALSTTYKGSAVRPLVKHKHPKFCEIEELEAPRATEAPLALVSRVHAACTTANRLAAVASKLGDAASAEELTDALSQDIEEAFWAEAPEAYQLAYSRLSEADEAAVSAQLTVRAAEFVKRWQGNRRA